MHTRRNPTTIKTGQFPLVELGHRHHMGGQQEPIAPVIPEYPEPPLPLTPPTRNPPPVSDPSIPIGNDDNK